MDGHHPDCSIVDQIKQPVKFEAAQWRAADIGKSYRVNFGMLRKLLRGGVNFLEKVRAQSGNLRVMPERGFHRVLVSGRKDFYCEAH